MITKADLDSYLKVHDKLITGGFREHPAITALRKLRDQTSEDVISSYLVVECFINFSFPIGHGPYGIWVQIVSNIFSNSQNIGYAFPGVLIESLRKLDDAKILTQECFDFIISCPKLHALMNMIHLLNASKILTRENIEKLIFQSNSLTILHEFEQQEAESLKTQKGRITPDLFTQNVFDDLIKLSRGENPSILLCQYFHDLCTPLAFRKPVVGSDRTLKYPDIARPYLNNNNFRAMLDGLHRIRPLTQMDVDILFQGDISWMIAPDFRFVLVLYRVNILTKENIEAAIHSGFFSLYNFAVNFAEALAALHEENLLTPKNRRIIQSYYAPHFAAKLLKALNKIQLLTAESQRLVSFMAIKDPSDDFSRHFDLPLLLQQLHKEHSLSQREINLLLSDGYVARRMGEDRIRTLHKYNILTKESFEAFDEAGKKFLRCDYSRVLVVLTTFRLLTQENFNSLVVHADSKVILDVLGILEKNNKILTQETFNVVITHTNLAALSQIMAMLNQRRILTQKNCDALMRNGNALLTTNAVDLINRLPPHLVTQNVFDELIRIAQNEDADRLLREYVNRLIIPIAPPQVQLPVVHQQMHVIPQPGYANIGQRALAGRAAYIQTQRALALRQGYQPRPMLGQQPVLPQRVIGQPQHVIIINRPLNGRGVMFFRQGFPVNGPQRAPVNVAPVDVNTHTESVHKSVSESAIKLFKCYGDAISTPAKLTIVIGKIKEYLAGLVTDTFEIAVAKRSINHFTDDFHRGQIADQRTGFTVSQFLALTWLAIHDDTKRIGTLESARAAFIDVLYQIKREGNISWETNIDDRALNDLQSCLSGACNKIINGQQGHHPDFEIIVQTKGQVALKFPIIVVEEIQSYLSSQFMKAMRSGKQEEIQAVFLLMEAIKLDGIVVILDNIRDSISNRVLEDFNELYPTRNAAGFEDLLKTIEDVNLSGVGFSLFKLTNEYYSYSEAQACKSATFFNTLRRSSLINDRCNNYESQHQYDSRYGLVPRS